MEKSNLSNYDKIDPEEIIIKLKRIIEFLQTNSKEKNLENGKEFHDSCFNRN